MMSSIPPLVEVPRRVIGRRRAFADGLLDVLGLAVVATAVVYLYASSSRAWTTIGGTKTRLLALEVPLFWVVTWLAHVPLAGLRPALARLRGWLLAVMPPLVLYVLVDGFFGWLHRAPRLTDLRNFTTLLGASPMLALGVSSMLAGVFVVPAVRLGLLARATSARTLACWCIPRLAVIVLLAVGLSSPSPLRSYVLTTMENGSWSERWSLRHGGRLASVAYLHARRAVAIEGLAELGQPAAQDRRFASPVTERRNLHLVVLESFVDPRLFEGVAFDSSPLHPRLARLLGGADPALDQITTPVYGGGTAQTEFELLTGLPALGRVESIEFNALDGDAVPSLVHGLRAQGYRTVATIATSSQFYNSLRAYRSLGFELAHFHDGASYLGDGERGILFDGELLQKNLEFVSAHYIERGEPVFNYVLGMYGHHPYWRDRSARPDVCRLVGGDGSSTIERVANQFWYRTGALADFLVALRERDPTAIVLVTSDHLPPLVDGAIRYRHELDCNICLCFVGTERLRWSQQPTFHVPYVLWERLSGQPIAVPDAHELERYYLATLAAGLGLSAK